MSAFYRTKLLVVLIALLSGCGSGSSNDSDSSDETDFFNDSDDLPLPRDDAYSTEQGTTLTVQAKEGLWANDDNVVQSRMVVGVYELPSNGNLSLELDGGFTYEPDADFVGTDTFTYVIKGADKSGEQFTAGPATVEIEVAPRADAPVPAADAYEVDEDNSLTVPVSNGVLSNDSDPNGDPLQAVLAAQPEHGQVALEVDGAFVYTPEANFNGTDAFSYQANDGTNTSAVTQVTIKVDPINDSPLPIADTYTVNEDEVLVVAAADGVLANDTDVDGDTLQASLVSQPAFGTVTLEGDGSFEYKGEEDFSGMDSFSYRASDGAVSSQEISVELTILPLNDPPVAASESYETIMNRAVMVQLLATDVDSDALEYQIVDNPGHGSIVLRETAGLMVYTPDADFVGQDTIRFRASDGVELSAAADITITVNPPPPPKIQRMIATRGRVGRPVQIFGSYFSGTQGSVRFGSTEATIQTWTDTYIVAQIPDSLSSENHEVVVSNAHGASQPEDFLVVPWIDRMVPADAAPGDTVVAHGTTFGSETGTVHFGDVEVAPIEWAPNSVSFKVPKDAAIGKDKVDIVDAAGQKSNRLQFTIRGFDEWHGPLSPPEGSDFAAAWDGSQVLMWTGSEGYHYNATTDAWSEMSRENAPAPVINLHVWCADKWLFFGGSTAVAYDPLLNVWSPINTDSVSSVSARTAVCIGDDVLLWGIPGDDGAVTGLRYSVEADSWSAMSNDGAPTVTSGYSAIWTGREMFLWGGKGDTLVSSGARYDPQKDIWRPMSDSGAPTAREGHFAFWTGTEMIIFGGVTDRTAYLYNADFDEWTRSSQSPSLRKGFIATWTGTEMIVNSGCVMNGDKCVYTNTGERYDPVTDQWTAMPGRAPLDTGATTASAWTGEQFFVYGQGWALGDSDTGALFTPSTNTWTRIAQSNALLSSRGEYTSVWSGERVIFWGGITDKTPHADGAVYNPVTDTWSPVSESGLSARYGHSAVWAKDSMIIWGGAESYYSPYNPTSTGARYFPQTDTWTPVSTEGGPPAASYATSVWTGTELLVWGGDGAESGVRSTGGIYDPSSDSWQPISPVGAPSARYHHTAVWTGSEMIIWGGDTFRGYGGLVGDGYAYTPDTDAWRPLETEGAPSARRFHEAVWTGTEMIVWGGDGGDPGDPLSTGAAYNPDTNTWRTISETGAVTLDSPSAVFTGDVVLVWGGWDDPWPFNSDDSFGSIYDPVTDEWTDMNRNGDPPPSEYSSATWTGDELVVWGDSLRTAYRYYP